jgi:nucleotide-binding universal stress UspA family protein
MYKKLVVPLDGSPLAEVALPYAEEIAGKMDSEIILLTVLATEETDEYHKHYQYISKIVDTTQRQVDKYVENGGYDNITVGAATRVGNPAEGILDYVNNGALNLIVMATHGHSGISRWAMGSVADKVVRATSRQPLLLIRAKGAHPDVRAKRILKKALVPLDGSEVSQTVIPFIGELALKLQMELTLLRVIPKTNHVFASTEAYLHKWSQELEEKGIAARYEVRVGSAADQIIDLADELASDMVAMSTRGQTAISIWPLGSVAQKVLLAGNTPLLLIKA